MISIPSGEELNMKYIIKLQNFSLNKAEVALTYILYITYAGSKAPEKQQYAE